MSDPLSNTCWDCDSPDVLDDAYHCGVCWELGEWEREVAQGAILATLTFPA